MNIIGRELRANLKGLTIWIACIAVFLILAGAEFESFNANEEVDRMMQSFPEGLRKAFSMDLVRFDRPEGYFSYTAGYLIMLGAIYAALAGTKMLSREIRRKTAETTFTLPATRRGILALKLSAAVIRCFALAVATLIVIAAVFSRFETGASFYDNVVLLVISMFFIQLLFLLAGFFVSVISRRHKRTGALMASLTVVIYMLSFIRNLGDKYELLKYFTPFEYFTPIAVMHGREIDTFGFIAMPVLILLFGFLSFALIEKKDIY
jgi:ABC-2 type transport system permease protein